MELGTRPRSKRAFPKVSAMPALTSIASLIAIASSPAFAGVAIASCSNEPAPISADVVGLLSGDSEGFARVFGPRDIVFPEDHGAHPDYRNEWWYYTGNLVERESADSDDGSQAVEPGRRFGFQLTVFRGALDPAPDAPESAWGSGQAYLAHFALTDVEANSFHSAERLSRGDAGLAGAVASPMRVWVETWEIAEVDAIAESGAIADYGGIADRGEIADGRGIDDGSSIAEVGGDADDGDVDVDHDFGATEVAPRVRLRAADGPVSIDLVLSPRKAPVLHGDDGYSPKGPEPGNASYYYSLTRQWAEGKVTTAEGSFEVEGEAWMDHEWSTSALSGGQTGWDWLSLQLGDAREVMVFRVREADGGIAPSSSGSVIDRDGRVLHLAREDFKLIPSGEWLSPRTGGRYPVVWRLEVPSEGIELEVVPLIEDQELDVGIRYWEGAVRATGRDTAEGRPIEGIGYLEMTGYAPSGGDGTFLP